MASIGMEAVTGALERYGRSMFRRARRILHSEADAEDVVQEVALTLLDAPYALAPVERLEGWLLTLVKRKAVDLIRARERRRKRESAHALEELLREAPDPQELMAREETVEVVVRRLAALPAVQREAFRQNALEGRTFREMSAESGTPMGTLMARKKKAVDAIREELRRAGLLPTPPRARRETGARR